MDQLILSMILLIETGEKTAQFYFDVEYPETVISRLSKAFPRTEKLYSVWESSVMFWAEPEGDKNPHLVVLAEKGPGATYVTVSIYASNFLDVNLALPLFETKHRQSSNEEFESIELHRKRSLELADSVSKFLSELDLPNPLIGQSD